MWVKTLIRTLLSQERLSERERLVGVVEKVRADCPTTSFPINQNILYKYADVVYMANMGKKQAFNAILSALK